MTIMLQRPHLTNVAKFNNFVSACARAHCKTDIIEFKSTRVKIARYDPDE
jgi:hypothetical protein